MAVSLPFLASAMTRAETRRRSNAAFRARRVSLLLYVHLGDRERWRRVRGLARALGWTLGETLGACEPAIRRACIRAGIDPDRVPERAKTASKGPPKANGSRIRDVRPR